MSLRQMMGKENLCHSFFYQPGDSYRLGDRMWERTTSLRKWQIRCMSDIFVAPSSHTVDTGFAFCFMIHFIRSIDLDCSYTTGDISSES